MRIKSVEAAILLAMSALVTGDGIVVTRLSRMRAGESGGYEILLGLTLACLTAVYWIRSGETAWPGGRGMRDVLAAFGILVGFALAMPYLGYLLSTFVVTLAYLRGLGGYRWMPSLAFALVFSVGTAWLWARLVVVLPQGPLPWPAM